MHFIGLLIARLIYQRAADTEIAQRRVRGSVSALLILAIVILPLAATVLYVRLHG